MRIKKFQGKNMRESIEKMRRELGEEAVILSTREFDDEIGLTMTELVAGIDPEDLLQHREQTRIPPDISHAAGERRETFGLHRPLLKPDAPQVTRSRPGVISASESQQQISVHNELQILKDSVNALLETNRYKYSGSLPAHYRQFYQELRKASFSEDQAMVYVGRVAAKGFHDSYADVISEFAALAESMISVTTPLQLGGDRQVILVIGPNGSGKTSLSQKLATTFSLTAGSNSLVVTQGMSSALQNQRNTSFTENLYESQDDLIKLLSVERDRDFVFVEVNLNVNHPDAALNLHSLCQATRPDSVLLTLPMGLNDATLSRWMKLGSSQKNCSVVMTMMDCNPTPGDVIGALRQHNVSISYLTDGRSIPQSIRAATVSRLINVIFPTWESTTPKLIWHNH